MGVGVVEEVPPVASPEELDAGVTDWVGHAGSPAVVEVVVPVEFPRWAQSGVALNEVLLQPDTATKARKPAISPPAMRFVMGPLQRSNP